MSPHAPHPEIALAACATLGEGALWDHHTATLLWVDILEKRVMRFDPRTGRNQVLQLDTLVGTVVPTERGALLVAVREGLARLDPSTGQLSGLVTPPGHDPQKVRFNDGKCDALGRLWAGSMALDESPGQGALYSLDVSGTLQQHLSRVSISNGLAWNADSTRMYYVDTPRRIVDAFDFDLASGQISGRRTAIEFTPADGYPDGMTIDVEGLLWVAMWGGSAVLRCDPSSGRILERVAFPASHITSCAFGGPNRDTLYVTSARVGLSEEKLAREPHAGALFAWPAPVAGVPARYFRD